MFNHMDQSRAKPISEMTTELDFRSDAKVIFGIMLDLQIAFQQGLQRNTFVSDTMNIKAGSGTTSIETCTCSIHPLLKRYLPWSILPR